MNRTLGLAVRAYAVMTHLYPCRFRSEFGEEMQIVFAEAMAAASRRGAGAMASVCAHELRDLPCALLREHLSEDTEMQNVTHGLRWIARVGSIASLGLILLIFVGEGFDPARIAPWEWVGLLFFPGGTALGMIMAWWSEKWGGIVAVLSLACFYFVSTFSSGSLPRGWAFVIFAAPGFLFLACSLLSRRTPNAAS